LELKKDAAANNLMWCEEDNCFLYEDEHDVVGDGLMTNEELAKELSE